MKRFLFLDNFRGFTDTYIPLLAVNFLVGENSTGKTSVLNLLRLISSPRFFLGADFTPDDGQFGYFNELVSAHAENRSFFRIGYTEERNSKPKRASKGTNQLTITGLLVTYREHLGLPKISQMTCSLNEKLVEVRFLENGKGLSRTSNISKPKNIEEMNNAVPAWVADHIDPGTGWKELTIPGGLSPDIPLAVILGFAAWNSTPKSTEMSFRLFMPPSMPPLVWIAPIRTKPRRMYDEHATSFAPDGAHTPYVIRRMLGSASEANKFENFMNGVGKASGLFQKIQTTCFGPDTDATAPFEVDAVVDGEALNLNWVGYGVSQSLPIFVELLDRPAGSWFAIQQPEVHLHPRAQASLGDVFFEMAMRDQKNFVIETHSDFTIDRFRMNYRKKKRTPPGQILFFERKDKHNIVTPLVIGKDGHLPADQPESYRQFFVKEELRNLGI